VSRSGTGSRAASGATECGQPRTTPLWLNSQRPSAKGAAAVSVTGIPAVADRTAASTPPDRVPAATAANEASDQIGCALR
jgi:hypothetical protein